MSRRGLLPNRGLCPTPNTLRALCSGVAPVHESITAGQRWGDAPSRAGTVLGCCDAAKSVSHFIDGETNVKTGSGALEMTAQMRISGDVPHLDDLTIFAPDGNALHRAPMETDGSRANG